jgi:hypothetical protein
MTMQHDNLRGTGRTSRRVTACLMAALAGQRVLYVCGSQASVDYASGIVRQMLDEMLSQGMLDHAPDRLTYSKDCVTVYGAGGVVTGQLRLRSLSLEDAHPINRGLRGEYLFKVIDDHHCADVRAEQEAKAQRAADLDTVRALLIKHGIKNVDISGSTPRTIYFRG